MFQYAFQCLIESKYTGKSVKADLNHFKLYKVHNGFELEDFFDVDVTEASRKEIKLLANEFSLPLRTNNISEKIIYGLELIYKKKHKHLPTQIKQTRFNSFDEDVLDKLKNEENLYLEGEWQNWNYYLDIEDELRKKFTFKDNFVVDNADKVEAIRNSNSVSIHLRRGDYVNNPGYDLCGHNYYDNALMIIMQRVENPKYYIFSDDIEYARKFFENLTNAVFVISKTSKEDMQLMSMCKHHIIANSSFSFWAAYIGSGRNENEIIVAPKYFYKLNDELCEFETPIEWRKIDNYAR